MLIHEKLIDFFKSFKAGSHPMAIMVGVVGALSAFDSVTNSYDMSEQHRESTCVKLIARMPTIAALTFRTSMGLPVVYPEAKYSFVENFLRMMFKDPMKEWEPNPVITRAMDKILLLHADHEQNASTSTVRITATSNANPFACIAAGIASLWGPMHGGANEACVRMLDEISSINNIPQYLSMAKDKNSTFRLMGFGHRVYKNFDPRSKVMKEVAIDILKQSHTPDKTLKLAIELEKQALADDYFISRKLYPNVDFYTGIVYRSIGIPLDMFTVMFAVARTSGWVCQWREMMLENQRKIGRPRQLYVGETKKPFVKIEDRGKFSSNLQEASEARDFPTMPKLPAFVKLPIL